MGAKATAVAIENTQRMLSKGVGVLILGARSSRLRRDRVSFCLPVDFTAHAGPRGVGIARARAGVCLAVAAGIPRAALTCRQKRSAGASAIRREAGVCTRETTVFVSVIGWIWTATVVSKLHSPEVHVAVARFADGAVEKTSIGGELEFVAVALPLDVCVLNVERALTTYESVGALAGPTQPRAVADRSREESERIQDNASAVSSQLHDLLLG